MRSLLSPDDWSKHGKGVDQKMGGRFQLSSLRRWEVTLVNTAQLAIELLDQAADERG
jgi:hypothetical protein